MNIQKILSSLFSKKPLKKPETTIEVAKPAIPHNPTPYKPLQILLTENAINAAIELKLPNPKTMMRRSDEWTKAFEWYNLYVNKTGRNLRMSCHPCWTKVYTALNKAKQK